MMVPSGERGLPKEWAKEFAAIAQAEAMNHFAEAANGTKPTIKTRKVAFGGGAVANDNASPKKKRRGGIRTIGGFIRQLQRIRALARKAGLA